MHFHQLAPALHLPKITENFPGKKWTDKIAVLPAFGLSSATDLSLLSFGPKHLRKHHRTPTHRSHGRF